MTTSDDPNEADQNGHTLLHIAARDGMTDIVQQLLCLDSIKADYPSKKGATALIKAAENGHIDIVMALLADSRVNSNHAMLNGETALSMARGEHQDLVVEALLADSRLTSWQAFYIQYNHLITIAFTVLVGSAFFFYSINNTSLAIVSERVKEIPGPSFFKSVITSAEQLLTHITPLFNKPVTRGC